MNMFTESLCKHPKVLVEPGKIEPDGDGFRISDMFGGRMFCQVCKDELPIEDLSFHHPSTVSIAIPTDLVDGTPDISEPAP